MCIHNPAKLTVSNSSLFVSQDGHQAKVPLEDIWVLIIETHSAQISTAALSSLADAGVGVMICGDNHMPNGLLLPLAAHSRHAGIVEDQLAISRPLMKRLWQRIVISKIANQARALDYCGLDSAPVKKYVKEVTSGDTSNCESSAASAYFRRILPEGNRRNGLFEAPLNYGYGVLRAGVARAAVAGGWLVSQGIHHHNNLNAFNLVDDLIEPFRPLVDLIVIQYKLGGNLTHESKVALASVFSYLVEVNGKRMSAQTAIELELSSLRAAVLDADACELLLPSMLPLELCKNE